MGCISQNNSLPREIPVIRMSRISRVKPKAVFPARMIVLVGRNKDFLVFPDEVQAMCFVQVVENKCAISSRTAPFEVVGKIHVDDHKGGESAWIIPLAVLAKFHTDNGLILAYSSDRMPVDEMM